MAPGSKVGMKLLHQVYAVRFLICYVAQVLYLGAASGTTVSHVSDLVGPEGLVYAVEFSHRSGRDLINMVSFWNNISCCSKVGSE